MTQGILSSLSDAGFIVNYPLIQLANLMSAKPILHISVYDYLWGYDDPMVKLAIELLPNFFNFQKFGLMDRVSNLLYLKRYIEMHKIRKKIFYIY